MATLSAVVDIQDRATAKFTRLTSSAKKFEQQLDRVERKLKSLATQVKAISSLEINIDVDLNTAGAEAKMAMLRAEIAALNASAVNIGTSGGGLSSGIGLDDADVDVSARIGRAARNRDIGFQRADNGAIGFIGTLFRLTRFIYGVTAPAVEFLSRTLLTFTARMIAGSSELSSGLMTAIGGFSKLMGAVGGVGMAFSLIAAAAGLLSGAIIVLASALTSLLVPIAALVPIVGAFFGAIGFGVLPIIFWTQKTKELVDQKEKLQEQLSKLTPGTQAYIDKQKELNKIQKELNENGGEAVFAKMKGFLDEIKSAVFTKENKQTFIDLITVGIEALRPLLPIISEAINKVGQVFILLATEFKNFTQSAEGQKFFKDLFNSMIPIIYQLGRGLGILAKLFGQIMIAAAPIAEKLLGDFIGWLEGISDELSKPGGLQGMRDFFDEMYPVFKDLAIILKDFINGLINMGREGAPLARAFFAWLAETGPKIVAWFRETWEKYGPLAIKILKIIGDAIKFAWNMFTNLVDAARPFIDIVLDIILFIGDLLNKVNEFAEASGLIDLIRLGFEGLAAAAKLIIEPFKWLWDRMQDIADFFSKFNPANWFGGQDEYKPGMNALTDQAILSGAMPVPPGFKIQGGQIVAGADGAIVTKPTFSLIGEAGPEAIVPLNKMPGAMALPQSPGQAPSNRPIQITGDLHFHGVQRVDDFVREIQKYVANLPKQSGMGLSG